MQTFAMREREGEGERDDGKGKREAGGRKKQKKTWAEYVNRYSIVNGGI
jgi:hypothetical protein